MSEDYEYMFKILIIGDSGAGKSCILLSFTENNFSLNHVATIGVDYKSKLVSLKGKKVKLQIWDTAGQERFRNLAKNYYQGAMGILITYDCSQKKTFENVRSWIETVKLQASEHTALVLIANKTDLDNKQVLDEEGKQLADELGIQFFLTSAKNGVGINEAFMALAQEIYDKGVYELVGNAANKRLTNKAKRKKVCC